MKRVLVTGAGGFIGRHAVEALAARGFEVHALAAPGEELPVGLTAVRREADLLDPVSTAKAVADAAPTHLLHLAWYAVPGKYPSSPINFAFVKASLSLFEAFAACGGKRAVAAGTCFEYDHSYGFCVENLTPLNPATVYGVCKNSLHMLARSFFGQAGVSFGWARLFFLFGPDEKSGRLISSVAGSLLRNEPALCTHGGQLRDFMYVKEAGAALAAFLASPVEGPVNVATGQPVSVGALVSRFAEIWGARDLIRLGAIPAPQNEPSLILADVKRLHMEVGFRPSLTLDQALKLTAGWWKGER